MFLLCTSDTVTPVNDDVVFSDLTSEETTYFENKDDISFVQISTPEVRSVVDQPFVCPDFDSYGVFPSGQEFSDCNIFFSDYNTVEDNGPYSFSFSSSSSSSSSFSSSSNILESGGISINAIPEKTNDLLLSTVSEPTAVFDNADPEETNNSPLWSVNPDEMLLVPDEDIIIFKQDLPDTLSECIPTTVYTPNDSSPLAQQHTSSILNGVSTFGSQQNANAFSSNSNIQSLPGSGPTPCINPESQSFPKGDTMGIPPNNPIQFEQPTTTGYDNNQLSSSLHPHSAAVNQKDPSPFPKPISSASGGNNKKPEKNKKQKRDRINFSGKDERILIMKWISRKIGGSTILESIEALYRKYYDKPSMAFRSHARVNVEELGMCVDVTIGRTPKLLHYNFYHMKGKLTHYGIQL